MAHRRGRILRTVEVVINQCKVQDDAIRPLWDKVSMLFYMCTVSDEVDALTRPPDDLAQTRHDALGYCPIWVALPLPRLRLENVKRSRGRNSIAPLVPHSRLVHSTIYWVVIRLLKMRILDTQRSTPPPPRQYEVRFGSHHIRFPHNPR